MAVTAANTVMIALGNGDGTFPPQKEYLVGACPAAAAIGYFNGDGKQDFAVADSCANNVTILTNTTR